MRRLAIAFVAATLLTSAFAGAQSKSGVPRTADGHSDLTGV